MPASSPEPKRSFSNATILHWMLGGVLVILAGWALRAIAPVAVPVVVAIFITLVVRPLDRRLTEAMPRGFSWLGRTAVMSLLLLLLALFMAGLWFSAQQLLTDLPKMADRLREMLPEGLASIAGQSEGGNGGEGAGAGEDGSGDWLGQFGLSLQSVGRDFGGWALDMAGSAAERFANAIGGTVAALVIVFFLVLIALGEAPTWNRKIDSICARHGREAWHDALDSMASRLRRFIVVRAFVGVLSAALYVAWLAIFGIDLLLVWAILTFLLTFIPNLGSVISGTLPVLYALVMVQPTTALIVGAGLFVIEQVIGNFVDPKLQGRTIVLSPLVILVSLLIWGWLWGVPGAFLAVPMTVAILIACNHVPALRPVALFLGNQPDRKHLDDALSD